MRKSLDILRKILIIGIFLLPLLVGLFQPMDADDFSYNERIANQGFGGFANDFYQHTGGRILNIFIMYANGLSHASFLFMGLLNGIVLVATIYLLASIAARHFIRPFQSKDSLIFLVTYVLVWLGLPDLGSIAFWRAGTGSYLYPGFFAVAFSCLFLLPSLTRSDNSLKSGFKTGMYSLMLFLLGVVAGSSAEQVFISLFIGAAVITIMLWKQKTLRVSFHLVGVLGLLAGGLILGLAPGNYVRLHNVNEHVSLLLLVFNAISHIGLYAVQFLFASFVIVILIVVYTRSQTWQTKLREHLSPVVVGSLVMAFSSMLIFFLVKAVSPRTFYFFVLFTAAAVSAILAAEEGKRESKKLALSSSTVAYIGLTLSLLLCFDMVRGIYSNMLLAADLTQRSAYISEQKAHGNKNITAPSPLIIDRRISYYTYLDGFTTTTEGDVTINVVGGNQRNIPDAAKLLKNYLGTFLKSGQQ